MAGLIHQKLKELKKVLSVTAGEQITKSVDVIANQTGAVIWTPNSGKRFVIDNILVTAKTAGDITIFDGTDDEDNRVLEGYPVIGGGVGNDYSKGRKSAAVDNVLKYTTGAGITGSISIVGHEEDA